MGTQPHRGVYGAAAAAAARAGRVRLSGAVDVAVDGSGHLGALSYLVPDGMTVSCGDAVEVGFGKTTRNGCVIGEAADPTKAVKPILTVWGTRADPADVALAAAIATHHGTDVAAAVARLSPNSGRGADPHDAGPVRCTAAPTPEPGSTRRLLLTGPCADAAAAAAAEAARMSAHGQVLVLCPTVADVRAVRAYLPSGAATLDAGASRGSWKGFVAGTVTVGVGTRSAALYTAPNLAGIVVLHPEHRSHLEQRHPRTHARDLASARARARNVPLTLISAKPGPGDLYAVAGHVDRIGGGWPDMRIADRTADGLSADERLIPPAMRIAAAAARKQGRSAVVVAGRARTSRRCRRCSAAVADCAQGCDPARACRHPQTCPVCSAEGQAIVTGWTPETLAAKFGDHVTVIAPSALTELRNAGTVIIFDYDTWLHRRSWTPDVDAVAVLVDAAAAAGAGGVVVAGTWNPQHVGLCDVVRTGDAAAVARRAVTEAKTLGLPPVGRRATVVTTRKTRPDVSDWPGHIIGPTDGGDGTWTVTVICTNTELPTLAGRLRAYTRHNRKTTILIE